MKVTVPGFPPVTTPVVGTTVAVPVIGLEAQVPPEFGERLIVPPEQTEEEAVTVGLGFTVKECSLKQPEVVSVYLKKVI